MKKLFKIIYYLLITAIIAVALLLTVSIFPIPGNYDVKVVLSGSMEPAIRVGSIIVIKPTDVYGTGDIITYGKDTKTEVPTTHRIIDSRVESGNMIYKTKGDANDDPDVREVREGEVIGKVLFSIPFLGYMIDFAKKPIGFGLLIIIPAVIVMFDEVRKIWREVKKMRTKRPPEAGAEEVDNRQENEQE